MTAGTHKGNGKAPQIEFPCRYPVKVMGHADAGLKGEVVSVFQRHAPEVDERQVTVRRSRHGNYLAITVVMRATGERQLRALFADLKAMDAVKMVL